MVINEPEGMDTVGVFAYPTGGPWTTAIRPSMWKDVTGYQLWFGMVRFNVSIASPPERAGLDALLPRFEYRSPRAKSTAEYAALTAKRISTTTTTRARMRRIWERRYRVEGTVTSVRGTVWAEGTAVGSRAAHGTRCRTCPGRSRG